MFEYFDYEHNLLLISTLRVAFPQGNAAHYAFGISIIINTILFDNFSIISLAIALFSYHNGPFHSIFLCLRRHIGRAPVLIAESPNNMCYHSCPCSDTKCYQRGMWHLISHSKCLLCKRISQSVFVRVCCVKSRKHNNPLSFYIARAVQQFYAAHFNWDREQHNNW